jgi:lipoyl(octanoyl) transferase
MIVPCGIEHKQVTSMEKELGRKMDIKEVENKIRKHFEVVFDVKIVD